MTGSGQSNKTLLMKRCNYHSGRVLMSAKEDSQIAAKLSANNDDQQPVGTSSKALKFLEVFFGMAEINCVERIEDRVLLTDYDN